MPITAVLFDIDGTLVDSNYLHVEAWSEAFHRVEAEVDAWRIHRSIGMDSQKLLDALLGADSPVAKDAKTLHNESYARIRIEDAIDIVTSGEDVEEAKPSPDIIAVAIERAQQTLDELEAVFAVPMRP